MARAWSRAQLAALAEDRNRVRSTEQEAREGSPHQWPHTQLCPSCSTMRLTLTRRPPPAVVALRSPSSSRAIASRAWTARAALCEHAAAQRRHERDAVAHRRDGFAGLGHAVEAPASSAALGDARLHGPLHSRAESARWATICSRPGARRPGTAHARPLDGARGSRRRTDLAASPPSEHS